MARIKYFQTISKNSIEMFIKKNGTRLVVSEYCINKLGQNHNIPQYDFFFTMGKLFLDQTYNKILTTSLEIL